MAFFSLVEAPVHARLAERLIYSFENGVRTRKDVVVPETQYAKSL